MKIIILLLTIALDKHVVETAFVLMEWIHSRANVTLASLDIPVKLTSMSVSLVLVKMDAVQMVSIRLPVIATPALLGRCVMLASMTVYLVPVMSPGRILATALDRHVVETVCVLMECIHSRANVTLASLDIPVKLTSISVGLVLVKMDAVQTVSIHSPAPVTLALLADCVTLTLLTVWE